MDDVINSMSSILYCLISLSSYGIVLINRNRVMTAFQSTFDISYCLQDSSWSALILATFFRVIISISITSFVLLRGPVPYYAVSYEKVQTSTLIMFLHYVFLMVPINGVVLLVTSMWRIQTAVLHCVNVSISDAEFTLKKSKITKLLKCHEKIVDLCKEVNDVFGPVIVILFLLASVDLLFNAFNWALLGFIFDFFVWSFILFASLVDLLASANSATDEVSTYLLAFR